MWGKEYIGHILWITWNDLTNKNTGESIRVLFVFNLIIYSFYLKYSYVCI